MPSNNWRASLVEEEGGGERNSFSFAASSQMLASEASRKWEMNTHCTVENCGKHLAILDYRSLQAIAGEAGEVAPHWMVTTSRKRDMAFRERKKCLMCPSSAMEPEVNPHPSFSLFRREKKVQRL